jgi:hypothetical protein
VSLSRALLFLLVMAGTVAVTLTCLKGCDDRARSASSSHEH